MVERPPRILVVDDDLQVRNLLSGILGDEGLSVTAVADGTEATALLDTREFSLVIMDVRLGEGQDGREVIERARLTQPELKSLYISGGTAGLAYNPDLDGFISKPFRKREVIGCVWELHYREPRRRQTEADATDSD
jgi:two-component system nitrogen regulation response regulator NtrX